MAKITALPVVDQITGDELLPIVQRGQTKQSTMTALRALITPFLQNWYKGDPGDPGPAGNVARTLAQLQRAPLTNSTMIAAYDASGSTMTWTAGDFTASAAASPADYVESELAPLTTGAWVRQTDVAVQSRRPQGRVRDVGKRLNDSAFNAFDIIPAAQHFAIQNRTSRYDATGDLGDAIGKARSGGQPLELPSGVFGVSGEGPQIVDGAQLFGAGQHFSVLRKLDPSSSYCILVSGNKDVDLRGFSADGARTAPGDYVNSNFGIYAHRAMNLRLFDVGAYGALGDGMTFEYCSGVRGMFLTCDDNNKDGLYCSGSDDVDFTSVQALRNRLIGIAMAATWDWSVSNVISAASGQAEFGISRDSRYFQLSNARLGDRYNGAAPVSLYVLAEPVGNQTLHLDANGNGGITYTDTHYAGAERGIFSGVKCRGRVDLEMLIASIFDDGCSMEDSTGAALNLFACSGNRFKGLVLRDYASNTGIGLLDSPKNGGVSNSDNTIEGGSWYKTGATDSYSRISDFAGKGGLREVGSSFNGTECMFGSADVTIPVLAAGAVYEVDVFVPLMRAGDAIERASFQRSGTETSTTGLTISYRFDRTNTCIMRVQNISTAASVEMPGTARIWFARK